MRNSQKVLSGFVEVGQASQDIFRGILEASSQPGRIVVLRDYLSHTPYSNYAALQILMAILDSETTLFAGTSFQERGFTDYLRFHTASRPMDAKEDAMFVWLGADESVDLKHLLLGTNEYPEQGATLIIDVPYLKVGMGEITLTGPGIQHPILMDRQGLPLSFWEQRRELQNYFPRGIDLFLCSGNQVLGIPRSTKVEF
jgi:alpha-D-ribose 1-methylphosphonate 5-triphosphate synthase subunit PhnH